MSSFHQVIIVGFLGGDPEMRYAPSGDAVTNFNCATNRSWTDATGTKRELTWWFRINVWGNQADPCNTYLHKGSKVLVVGSLIPDENGNPKAYSRKDGSPGASFEVRADRVVFLDRAGDGGARQAPVDPFGDVFDKFLPQDSTSI